ncbi:dihydropteroate synthase [Oceanicola sp. 502str15]|uniref:dihydropteroate synthase n=1 Tax=Oceanicola sp. 502str15 TaxID=2696061 RepID=UPI0020951808|nr:dihydropteroate synthase [Oceanicola sp. 502str15]MCO6382732.1 dihydropteroate synthase [Oceanicola sp. 502str15]
MRYIRPLVQTDAARPEGALVLAGGWCWFDRVEVLGRGVGPEVLPVAELSAEELAPLTAPRAPVAGLAMDAPRIMAILNITPDSFSDGGRFDGAGAAVAEGVALDGVADLLDIGGESTRPGAVEVPVAEEISRVVPVVEGLRAAGVRAAISLDTRKAAVAYAGLKAGGAMINDVSAMLFDPKMAEVAGRTDAAICLMHAQGAPETMQDDPRYTDVLLDVYDHLAERIEAATRYGIRRERIVIDPGIGFGKTMEHNLALLGRLSLFHSLGCPVLLGVSRKGFIGKIGGAEVAAERMPGSLALAVLAAGQGVQLLRVHDARETRQGLRLASAQWGM